VGNGHAAAGFSAGRAPIIAADDGDGVAVVAAGLAFGLAAWACFFFFLPAVFLPALLTFFFT